MAEEETAGKGLGQLTKAKIGPVPMWVIAVAGLALWWYLQRKSSTGTSTGQAPNQQTDPAGNIGSIDPATGYVYGTPEDTASLAANNAGTGSGGGSSTGSSSTTAGQYATDTDWGRAAINYLVGLGIDPTTANQAIQQYLASQTLTTEQQGDVNLAIQGLGAPPQPPTSSQTNPTPVVGGGGSAPNASNPPTGLATGNITNSTIGLKWNAVSNATGYTIDYGTDPSASQWSTTAPGSGSGVTSGQVENPGVTIGNLAPGTTYYFKVQGTPASSSGGWAGPISATTQGSAAQPVTPSVKTSTTPAPAVASAVVPPARSTTTKTTARVPA